MAQVHYIDPVLEEGLQGVPEKVQKEVDLTFDVALRIHEILIRKNWTQADLAAATQKKEALVSSWLSGRHNFTLRTITEIEVALGEDIISVKRYRKPSQIVDGYKISPRKAAFLSEAATKYGKQ